MVTAVPDGFTSVSYTHLADPGYPHPFPVCLMFTTLLDISFSPQVQQFAATDRIVDLSEEGFATKIYDSVKDACSYDGKIYAYPMNLEMLGVYYNQE